MENTFWTNVLQLSDLFRTSPLKRSLLRKFRSFCLLKLNEIRKFSRPNDHREKRVNHTRGRVLSRGMYTVRLTMFRIVVAKPIEVKLPFWFSGTGGNSKRDGAARYERKGKSWNGETTRGNCCGHVTKFIGRWDFQRRQLTIRVRLPDEKGFSSEFLNFRPAIFHRNPLDNYSGWKRETRSTRLEPVLSISNANYSFRRTIFPEILLFILLFYYFMNWTL